MTNIKTITAYVFAAALLFPAAVPSFSEDRVVLNLNDCFSRSKENSQTLKAQDEIRKQAYQRVIEAKGGLFPNLSYQYYKTYQDTAGDVLPGEVTTSKAELTQPLFEGFTRVNAFKANKKELNRQQFLYEVVNRQLLSGVANAFYTFASHESDYMDIGDTIDLLGQRVTELNARVNLGKSRSSEVLVVQSAIASFKAQQEQTKGDGADSLENLSYLTGVDSSKISIADDTPEVTAAEPLDSSLERALNRSDMRAMMEQIDEQKYLVGIAKGVFSPTLDLDANYYLGRSYTANANSKWDLTFSVYFPIFQGGVSLAKVREQQSILRQLEDQRLDLERSIRKEVQTFYRELVSAIAQAEALKDAYNKADESYKLQLRDYRLGLVENIDVLQSMNSFLDAKTSLDRSHLKAKAYAVLLDISSEKIK